MRNSCQCKETHIGMTSQVTRTVHVNPNIAMNENRRCTLSQLPAIPQRFRAHPLSTYFEDGLLAQARQSRIIALSCRRNFGDSCGGCLLLLIDTDSAGHTAIIHVLHLH